MRVMLGVALATALAAGLVSVAAAGESPVKTANAYCKANKAVLVGPGRAYKNHGQCLKAQKALGVNGAKNAAKACKAEMADPSFAAGHGGASFEDYYGTNGDKGNGKSKGKGNAFGKCVSARAREGKADGQDAQVKGSKLCKAWRANDDVARAALGGMSFSDKFGTANNAYGKCVSAQAKAAQQGS